MGGSVVRIAVLAAKLKGYPSVLCRRKDEEELLQVRPMILGETVGDRRRTPTTNLPALGFAVPATKPYRGGVVVKLVQSHVELPNGRNDDIREEGGTVGIEKAVQ